MNAQLMQKQGTLPQTAGDVPIHYQGNSYTKPRLKGRSIVLPRRFTSRDKLFPLQKGRQLLFLQHASRRRNPRLHFFGLDETYPFTTELNPYQRNWSWKAFKKNGERAFYDSLRPYGIRKLEEKYRRKGGRQGDWWFMPLPYSWEIIQRAYRITQGERLTVTRVRRARVGDSNHRLTGKIAQSENYIEGIWMHEVFLAEGVLEAPHHATRTLKGPHLLVQRGKD